MRTSTIGTLLAVLAFIVIIIASVAMSGCSPHYVGYSAKKHHTHAVKKSFCSAMNGYNADRKMGIAH